MFEFIGILVVCWILYSVFKGVLRGVSTARSREFGKEARHITVNELGVPDSYYSYMATNKIESIKKTAAHLRDNDKDFRNCSWSRLLALVIYAEFHQDCDQWRHGNPIREQLFANIGITPEIISMELSRDAREVLYGSL